MKTKESNSLTQSILDCAGYRKLLAAVERDEREGHGRWHHYRGKLEWIVARARHYAEKTGLRAEAILDAWEERRGYWYMNYYQESNQPEIKDGRVRVFDTVDDLTASIGESGFHCPSCAGVSKSPYECTLEGCDWKVYGLFRDMGKGVSVFVKKEMAIENLFTPVAWESNEAE